MPLPLKMRPTASFHGHDTGRQTTCAYDDRLVEQIAQLDRHLASPACQVLMSIPDVGVQTSARLRCGG